MRAEPNTNMIMVITANSYSISLSTGDMRTKEAVPNN